MAESEFIVKIVLNKLTDVVLKEALHGSGVKGQVEGMSQELSRIHAFLKDVDKKQIPNEIQKQWLKEIRDIAYSIGDAIDNFLSKVLPKPQNPASMTLPRKRMLNTRKTTPMIVHNLATELARTKQRMMEFEGSIRRYGINTLGEDTGEIKLPISPHVLPDIDPDVVGFKEERHDDETEGHQFRMDIPDLEKHPEDETEGHQFQMGVLDVEKHQEDEIEGPQFQMDIPDLEKRKRDETEGHQLQMGVPDLEKRPEDDTEGRQFRMDIPDLEKHQEDETNGCSIMASLTTTPEGNKDEKLNIIISLIGLLATAAGIAAIPVPENSRKMTLGKICSDLFDILVLIFLGALIIFGIYVKISKAKGMKHISISYFVFFFILVVCSILKMVTVAVGDL